MIYNLDIPDDFQKVLSYLTSMLPDQLRNDAATKETIAVYLKFGGVKLAQHGIGIIKMFYYEDLRKKLKAQKQAEADDETSDSFLSKTDDLEFFD